jgi:hypothetical protein
MEVVVKVKVKKNQINERNQIDARNQEGLG